MSGSMNRRHVLLGAAALASSACRLTPAGQPASSWGCVAAPPVARRENVVDELWGVQVPDPYRWMENPEDPDWYPFLKGQTSHARQLLDRIPGRERHKQRLTHWHAKSPTLAIVSGVNPVQVAQDQYFFLRYPPSGAGAALYVKSGKIERLIFDAGAIFAGKAPTIDWWRVSPNGQFVVVGVSFGGSEDATAYTVSTETAELLPGSHSRALLGCVSWLADSSGFFITRFVDGRKPTDPDYLSGSRVWLHRINTDPHEDVLVLQHDMAGVQEDERFILEVEEQPGEDWVLGVSFYITDVNPIFVASRSSLLAGAPSWRRVASREDLINHNRRTNSGIAVRGGRIWLLTNLDAPNGKLISVDIEAADMSEARTELAESDRVLQSFFVTSHGIYLQDLDAGYNLMRRIHPDGRVTDVSLPVEGTIIGFDVSREANPVLVATGWLDPPTAFRFQSDGSSLVELELEPIVGLSTAAFDWLRTKVTARDGVEIPVSIVYRKGIARDGASPMLMHVYGTARLPYEPRYDPALMAFLEAGGVVAVAHVRGGGEYGRSWSEAAAGAKKPVSYFDLIDCCEGLIAQGWTSRRRLTITGASGAGMVLGMALTQRPDLFAAVIPEVATLNMLRFEFTANGTGGQAADMSIYTPEGFRNVFAMDGYTHVERGKAYPAVLLTHGLNDVRVAPWMSTKMAAALQWATTSGEPVLLKIDCNAGHGVGSAGESHIEHMADIQAFALWQSGVDGFQPTDC